ncbi:DNA-primase RepB domain-containing protein [Desulfovibrio falkowii]|uniref:DNA-primase RepB domain-containing protein n=1 Tax=Desulfovibrio sp. WGS1351 TaxID=3366814 RepID=UPI00372CE96C
MIAKKQPKNTQYTKSRAQDVGDLCRYICDARSHMTSRPTLTAEPEKVLCSGSLGLNFETLDAKISEMAGLASQARSGNPVDHWVLSWQAHETPTPAQLHEAARMFVHELGLDGHQVIYGAHQNTQNTHLHLAINRVSPSTGRVIKVNKGFDHLAAAKAICVIEHVQGWNQEPNPVFKMTADGPKERTDRKRGLSDAARAAERSTALPSLERRAKALAPTIAAATGWQDLHIKLAAHGATYEKRKGGAVIKFGKSGFIKASKASRAASLAALEKRFGAPFERPERLVPRPYEPKPPALRSDLDPVSLILALIFRLLGFHRAARTILHTQQELERAELRAAKFASAQAKWAAQSVMREEHAAARAELKATQDAEIAAIKVLTPAQALAFCEQHNLFPVSTTTPIKQTTTTAAAPATGAAEKKEYAMSKNIRYFDAIHTALGADRYRLTARAEAGIEGQRDFTFGKKAAGPEGLTETGAFKGWTPDEVRFHMPEVVKSAQKDKYGVYITPLSESTYYINVDDINTPEKLAKLAQYSPAVIVESSPGNQQAILKIRADGDPKITQKAANATALRINRECGDPGVKNGVQAWRLPGFVNNKPKHRQENGYGPEVALIEDSGKYCERAQAIYAEELAKIQEEAINRPQHELREVPAPIRGNIPTNECNDKGIPWADLYAVHCRKLADDYNVRGKSLDFAVACKLRALNYSDGQATRIIAHSREWNSEFRHGDTAPQTWEEELKRAWDEHIKEVYYTKNGDYHVSRLGPNAIKAAKRAESEWARTLKAQQPQQPVPDQEPEKPARRRRSRGR